MFHYNIHKPYNLKDALIFFYSCEVLPEPRAAFNDLLRPAPEICAFHCIINTFQWEHNILDLKIATWIHRGKSMFKYSLVTAEAGSQHAAVDIVKLLRKEPWIFHIADLKVTVKRDTIMTNCQSQSLLLI